jgi:hypothetical protein
MTGPRRSQRITDQELERLQPAVAPGQNDRCDDEVCADQRLEGRAVQQTNDAAARRQGTA